MRDLSVEWPTFKRSANSASTPIIRYIALPLVLVVSMASVSEWNFTPPINVD